MMTMQCITTLGLVSTVSAEYTNKWVKVSKKDKAISGQFVLHQCKCEKPEDVIFKAKEDSHIMGTIFLADFAFKTDIEQARCFRGHKLWKLDYDPKGTINIAGQTISYSKLTADQIMESWKCGAEAVVEDSTVLSLEPKPLQECLRRLDAAYEEKFNTKSSGFTEKEFSYHRRRIQRINKWELSPKEIAKYDKEADGIYHSIMRATSVAFERGYVKPRHTPQERHQLSKPAEPNSSVNKDGTTDPPEVMDCVVTDGRIMTQDEFWAEQAPP